MHDVFERPYLDVAKTPEQNIAVLDRWSAETVILLNLLSRKVENGGDGSGEGMTQAMVEAIVRNMIAAGGGGGSSSGVSFNIGNGLNYNLNTNTLSIDVTDDATANDMRPITSNAVRRDIGNIDVLLQTI